MHEDIHWHLPAHIRAELDHEIDMTEARLAGLLPQAPAHEHNSQEDT
jgi:hypothetical protein